MEKTEPLDQLLENTELDAFLMKKGSDDADMYYLTGFERSDPFIFLRQGGESTIIVSQLEYSRAKDEADVEKVLSTAEFDLGDREDRDIELLKQVTEKFNIEKLAVPENFSLKLARDLEDKIEIEPVENRVMDARKMKSSGEIEKLEAAQEATEAAMQYVEDLIKESEIRDSELYLDGEPLTSERVRREIKKFLLERDCDVPHQSVVACGEDSAMPHSTGSGALESGKPVVVDIFPRHENRYFGDMTRTFVKGKPDEEVLEMKEAVLEAQEEAFDVLESGAGVEAREVHSAVCDVLESHGFSTLREDSDTESGFIHSTGHAVGLELHEPPGLSENDEELEVGNVLTVEPGLYIPTLGGVRIEDMVVVKEDGYKNLNSMHKNVEVD